MNAGFLFSGLFEFDRGIQVYNRNLLRCVLNSCRISSSQIYILNDTHNDPRIANLTGGKEFKVYCAGRSKFRFITSVLKHARTVDCFFMTHIAFSKLIPLIRFRNGSVGIAVTLHGVESWRKVGVMERRGLNRANIILPVSNYTKRKFVGENKIEDWNFSVLPNVLQDEWYDLPVKQVPELNGKRFILSAGFFSTAEKYKGADNLISAFAKTPACINSDIRLVISGGGDDLQRLSSVADKHGVADRVVFTGEVARSELKWLYDNCLFFALPSRGEGFGIVYLEAMASSKAVIACRNCGAEDPVKDERNGILVSFGNEQELVSALDKLVTDHEMRNKMGLEGSKLLKSEFSFSSLLPKIERVLTGLMANDLKTGRQNRFR